MTTAVTLKYLLALAAVLGIWIAPGRSRSSFVEPLRPIPVYLTGGQIIVVNGRAVEVEKDDVRRRNIPPVLSR